MCPLIYTLSMSTVIISHIMANSFLINLCNALSDSHGISDADRMFDVKNQILVMGISQQTWPLACIIGVLSVTTI